jgi:hypothetical protein
MYTPAVRSTRRSIAVLLALAIAWTALWPLVSSLHLVAATEAMPLCHQAGMQVTPDMPAPVDPGTGERKQHCPLCIMAFLVAFMPPVVPASPPDGLVAAALAMPDSAPRLAAEYSLPQSRAPPFAS